jgi:hypothetical protein
MTATRVLGAYRATFVACIVALSALTMAHAPREHAHATVVACAEILGALLLLFRRTQRVGLAGLLLVFALAAVVTVATTRQPPVHLVIYAASAIVIVALDGRVG